TTGTVRLKAELPNADLRLWPGAFVNVKLLIDTLRNVLLVPTASVQRGPNGAFVYVLQDGKAVMRQVTVTYQDEQRSVLTSGLDDAETVLTTGFAQLRDGKEVTVTAASGGSQAAPGAEAARQKRGGGEGRNWEGRG